MVTHDTLMSQEYLQEKVSVYTALLDWVCMLSLGVSSQAHLQYLAMSKVHAAAPRLCCTASNCMQNFKLKLMPDYHAVYTK